MIPGEMTSIPRLVWHVAAQPVILSVVRARLLPSTAFLRFCLKDFKRRTRAGSRRQVNRGDREGIRWKTTTTRQREGKEGRETNVLGRKPSEGKGEN